MKLHALLMVAGASLALGAPVSGSLLIYTPQTPFAWPMGQGFSPEGPGGSVQFGFVPVATSSDVATPLNEYRIEVNNLLMGGKTEVVSSVVSLVYGGVEYPETGTDFAFSALRHYPVGSSVSTDDPVAPWAVYGWGLNDGVSRTYRQRDMTVPAAIHTRELPLELTIGFELFSFDTGFAHCAWADIRWQSTGGTSGFWEITRWAYETTPEAPARVAPPSGCVGDANGDGDTNGGDLSVLLAGFGTSVAPGAEGDLNGDGVINGADLSVLLAWFGCDEV